MKFFFPVIMLSLGLAACTSTEPYVYKSSEFNREAQGFGQPEKNISSVTICYSSAGAKADQVRQLASASCAEFGKEARFSHQDFKTCPLLTPVAAHFECE
jgi:hypothetical protein